MVYILLKIARDKAFNRFEKLNKGKSTHRVSEINKRHAAADTIITKGIRPSMKADSTFLVQSQNFKEIVYQVKYQSQCTKCKLRCFKCSAMYTCTCLDSVTHTTVCKHTFSPYL